MWRCPAPAAVAKALLSSTSGIKICRARTAIASSSSCSGIGEVILTGEQVGTVLQEHGHCSKRHAPRTLSLIAYVST